MDNNDNLTGYVLLVMIFACLLVLAGMVVYFWIGAFLEGDRFIVFFTGGAAVVFVNVIAWALGRNFEIVRKSKGK